MAEDNRDEDTPSLAEDLRRLEEIVRRLESDDGDLDQALALFEEGVARLRGAQRRRLVGRRGAGAQGGSDGRAAGPCGWTISTASSNRVRRARTLLGRSWPRRASGPTRSLAGVGRTGQADGAGPYR